MSLKMKIAVTAIFLVSVAALIYRDSPRRQASRLRHEAMEIQINTAEAILKNDLKFEINLDEQEQFYERLKANLQRCRTIEAKLRKISPGEDLLALEKATALTFELIAQRERENARSREEVQKWIEAKRIDWDKVPPWEPGAAGPPGPNKPAARPESKPEGTDNLQPEPEGLPR